MISDNGVYYGDLKDSPFNVMVGEYKFYFSQASKLNKFLKDLPVKIEWLNDSFNKRFHADFNFDDLAIFSTYERTETRGFCYSVDDVYFYHLPIFNCFCVHADSNEVIGDE